MRCGELSGVVWGDLDLKAGTLQVSLSLGLDHGVVFVKEPKSAAGRRLVGIDTKTVDLLRSHRSRLIGDRLAAGADYELEPLGFDLVFRNGPSGGLIRPDIVSRTFTKEWSHAGLRRGVTLHSLRHSMASLLVGEGFSFVEVAARMGHSVEVLQRTYARDLDPVAREKRVVKVITARFVS
jgi:integrase